MADGEDWLFRPVAKGYCSYESIVNPGVLDLADVATMNDLADVQEENELIANRLAARSRKNG